MVTGVCGSGQRSLIRIESGPQARALGADVTEFHKPVASKFVLNGEVPLLRGARDPMQRHRELDQPIHVAAESRGTRLWSRKRTGRKSLKNRRCGHVSLRWIGAERRNAVRECRAVRKQVRQTVLPGVETNQKWVSWRNDGEIVHRSQILAHAVNSIATADRGDVVASHVICKTNAWLPDRGVFVVQARLIQRPGNSREAEFVNAFGVDVGLPSS